MTPNFLEDNSYLSPAQIVTSIELYKYNELKQKYINLEMTLRDEFAKTALMGITSNDRWQYEVVSAPDKLSKYAYNLADAMLATRRK